MRPLRGTPAIVVTLVAAALLVLPSSIAGAAETSQESTDPAAQTASIPTTFTFYGSGWGHGVGMSQYGAYGLAKKGWSGVRILEHFYQGTTVGKPANPPKTIRVGLLQGRDRIRVRPEGSPSEIRLDGKAGTLLAEVPVGETWTIDIRSGAVWIEKPDGSFVGAQGHGTSDSTLFVVDGPSASSVYLAQTGHTYDAGWMEVEMYEPCTGCTRKLRLVNVLGIQPYLYGIAEVPSSWPAQVLEAQARAARTYAFYRITTSGQHRAICDCAVYGSTLDQVFVGADKQNAASGQQWLAAVDATADEAILKDGALVSTFYHSSSGGYTEDVQNVWGGDLPYLQAVCDPGDYTSSNPNRTWVVSMDGVEIGNMLQAYTGQDIGDARSFSGIVRGLSGRIVTATVNGTQGTVTLSGSALRRALGLKDTRVWVNKDRNITGPIRDKYDSLMCRPGLAQSSQVPLQGGSYQAFEDGRIYHNAATGKAYWIRGPILDKYVGFGAHQSVLALPASNVKSVLSGTASLVVFSGGRIYWSAATGAWEVHGPILEKYLSLQGASGRLGLPLTDVYEVTQDKLRAKFQGGSVTCKLSTGFCWAKYPTG